MKRLKVNFYLKGDKFRQNENAIYLKINIGTTTTTMSTGKYISKERWKITNMLLTAKKVTKEISLKNYINGIEGEIEKIYINLLKDESLHEVNAVDVKNVFLGKEIKEKIITFTDVCEFHIKHFKKRVLKNEVTIGTLTKYERVARIFKEFLNLKHNINNIETDKITDVLIYGFDDYLRYERPNIGNKGVCNNTAVKYLSNLKTIFDFSVKRRYILRNPFNIYEEKLEEVETVFLDPIEFSKLKEAILPTNKLNTVRDIFLFSCYTSYAPVDAMNLTLDNLDLDMDGEKWIRTRRQKSKVKSDIIILPPVREIINKYKNDPRCIEKGNLLPRYSNQKMNQYLKEIANICKIKKHLTWYVSRHTFATTVCLNNKIPLEYISKMMGHRKITQTQHYAKLLDETVKFEASKLKLIYS
tara:strand:+ start:1721 stop:2962 length:1242 start_codon:yes stop_codon:yes gene_type:complete